MFRPAMAAIAAALLLHLYVVAGLLRQPVDVNARPDGQRSPIWPLHNDTIHRQGPAGDFFGLYHAGLLVDRGLSPYAGTEAERPRITPYHYPFRSLPAFATFGRIWTLFTPLAAYHIWILCLELVLLLLILALSRGCPAPSFPLAAALILLLSSPYFLELHMGQYTFVTMALVAFTVLLVDARPRSWLAGAAATALFVLGAVFKVIPLVVLPALWMRSKAVAVACVLAFLAVTAPGFLANPEHLETFYRSNFSAPVYGMDGGNHGFVYLALMASHDLGLTAVTAHWHALARALQALLLGGVALLTITRSSPRADVAAATLLLAHFTSYAHVWEHHMSGVIILGLLLARRAAGDGQWRAFRIALVACAILALPTPYGLFDVARDPRVWDPTAQWPPYARYACLLPKVLPTLALLFTGIAMQLRSPEEAAE